MSFINYSSREINCKIVYYGPGLCGKTTRTAGSISLPSRSAVDSFRTASKTAIRSKGLPGAPFRAVDKPKDMLLRGHSLRPSVRCFLLRLAVHKSS